MQRKLVNIIYITWISLCSPSLQASSKTDYIINSAASDIRVLVYREGPLKLMGHNHVISLSKINGTISKSDNGYNLIASVNVNTLIVDKPEDRKRSGEKFKNKIDTESAEATRENMLGKKLLDAKQFPQIQAHGTLKQPGRNVMATIVIQIQNTSSSFTVPIDAQITGNRFHAIGRLNLKQSEFGLKPYSVMGGLLSVRDELELVFSLYATRN